MIQFPRLMPDQLHFLRSQTRAALPLCAQLFDITLEQAQLAYGARKPNHAAEPMPLRLLQELVEQRRASMRSEHFIERESSIVRCAE